MKPSRTPSREVLERNLELLLTRSYRALEPSPEFVRRLEGELAPWLAERRGPRRMAPLWGSLLAAAGLLLLWFAIDDSQPNNAIEPGSSLEQLLGRGEVAVREGDADWRAATDVELRAGIEWAGGVLALATPETSDVELVAAGSWGIALGSKTRLSVSDEESSVSNEEFVSDEERGVRFSLELGRLTATAGASATAYTSPETFYWNGEQFLDSPRNVELSQAEQPSGRENLAEQPGPEGEEVLTPVAPEPTTTASLRGRAVDAESGEPLDDFDVSLLLAVSLPNVSQPMTTHYEGTAGEFLIEGLEPGQYSLYLQSQGHAAWRLKDFVLQAGETLELEPELDGGVRLSGFVVDRETGAAIAGALVIAEHDVPMQVVALDPSEFLPEVRAYTHTAADGSFTLENIGAGRQLLRASGPQHAPDWSAEFEVGLGSARSDLLFELGLGGGVHGVVQREGGEAWSNARVIVSRFDPTGGASTMTYRGLWTDAEGRYSAEHLAPGYYVVLLFGDIRSEEDYGDPEYSSVQIREGVDAQVDFLEQGAGVTLSGVVRDSLGEPMAGVNLQLHRGSGNFRAGVTDEHGAYSIEVEEPGRYLLFAGVGDSGMRVATLKLEAGEVNQHDCVLRGESLRVEVRDEQSGERLTAATLLLFDSGSTSRTKLADLDELVARTWRGSSGEYVVTHVPGGEYDLLLLTESGDYATTLIEGVELTDGEQLPKLTVDLPRAGRARVEVVDPEGAAVEGARLQLVHPHGRRWRFADSTKTNSAGYTRLGGLLPGTWGMSVRAAGFEKAEVEFDVDEGLERVMRVTLTRR